MISNPEAHARKIAEAASAAWWGAYSGGMIEIPLGVVAALALTTRADPDGRDPGKLILRADRDEFADLLRHIWAVFAIVRPELVIRVGPFARWLEENTTAGQLDGAHATARAVIKAGLLDLTSDRELVRKVDVLGSVYQELRSEKARKTRGEVYTPTTVADAMACMALAEAPPGASICDPAAGSGGLLRAAAEALRARGIDPREMRWSAADVDPIAVAALAVNAHLWGLGRHVVVGCANVLAEPDWEVRALAEQKRAIEEHNVRVFVARVLAAEQIISAVTNGGAND